MSKRGLTLLLFLLAGNTAGCALETSKQEPAATTSAQALTSENDSGDFSVGLIMIDYNADGHVYKSPTVTTPLVSRAPNNAWSAWAQMPTAGEQVTGIRVVLLPASGTGILYKQPIFKSVFKPK